MYRYLCLFLGLIISASCHGECEGVAEEIKYSAVMGDFAPKNFKFTPNCVHYELQLSGLPVSIAHYKEKQFFICNYWKLFLLDLSNATVVEIPAAEVRVWNPTTVQYSSKSNLIYLANYGGRNLLILRYADNKLDLIDEIRHPLMTSPETLAVSEDEQVIAAADFDGSLFVFNRAGELLWHVDQLPGAHGLAIYQNKIYVTSLGKRELRVYDLNGHLLQAIKSQGWDGYDFMWPTGLLVDENGVYVTDAHQGRVCLLEPQFLKPIQSFGGNGPGKDLFNMPYGFCKWNNDLVVTDTYKQRLLVFNKEGICHTVIGKNIQGMTNKRPLGFGFKGYLDMANPFVLSLPGLPDVVMQNCWYNEYGRFLSPKDWLMLYLPSSRLFSINYQYFAVHASYLYQNAVYTILGSSQGSYVILDSYGRGVHAKIENNAYLWQDGANLVDDYGDESLKKQLAIAAEKFALHDALRSSGTVSLQDIHAIYWPEYTWGEFQQYFAENFISIAGKEFLAAYRSGVPVSLCRDQYLNNLKNYTQYFLQEYALINLLAY